MDTRCSPRQLAIDLLGRSSCNNIKVGAVIVDRNGRIFAWGWNSPGNDGLGLCAERHAIYRANAKRLSGSTVFVAGRRMRNGRFVTSRPCNKCIRILRAFKVKTAEFITPLGEWEKIGL